MGNTLSAQKPNQAGLTNKERTGIFDDRTNRNY